MKKKIDRMGEINSPTITVGHFNNLLSVMYSITRQNTSKEIQDLNNMTNQ